MLSLREVELDRLLGVLQGQQGNSELSLFSEYAFAGQQPVALEDKHVSRGRPLQAQPEKRVTSAASEAGATD